MFIVIPFSGFHRFAANGFGHHQVVCKPAQFFQPSVPDMRFQAAGLITHAADDMFFF